MLKSHSFCALLLLLGSQVAMAVPIEYRFTGNIFGSLDGVDFGYTSYELTLTADSDYVWVWGGSEPGYPIYQNLSAPGDAVIDIAGVGQLTFIQGLLLVAQSGAPYTGCEDCIGILDAKAPGGAFIFLASDPTLVGHDLTTSVAEVTTNRYGTTSFGPALLTDGGQLVANVDTFTFSAATVPVPAAAWLFASALGLAAWLRRRAPGAPSRAPA